MCGRRVRSGRISPPQFLAGSIVRTAQAKLAASAPVDVPLDLDAATPLEREILSSVAEIRSGYARPCELIARDVGPTCAPESVARVLAQNAVPLLVPCHRVVSDGRCCGDDYIFGAPAQQQLLASEGLDAVAVDRVIARGFRYIENDGWFCLPTCGDIAVRIDVPCRIQKSMELPQSRLN